MGTSLYRKQVFTLKYCKQQRLRDSKFVQCMGCKRFLRAQERPATLILTLTSGLRITRARQVYNRDAETGI